MFQIREEQHKWVLDLFYDVKIPESKRQETVAFLTQIIDGLTSGTFEMNPENGEMCFRTRVMATDQSLTSEEIDQVVRSALATATHALPGFLAIICADQPPKEATTPFDWKGTLRQTQRGDSIQKAEQKTIVSGP